MEGETLSTPPPSAESVSNKTSAPEPTSAEKKPERNMTSREETVAKLKSARDIISNSLDQGFFGKEGEEKYNQAKTALSYKGTGGDSDREASDQLLAMTDSVRAIAGKDPQAQELSGYFTENIKVFNQTDGQTYSLEDWEKQLAVIQNDDSLSREQKESKTRELEENAFRGFLLQKEGMQLKEQQKSAENIVIVNYRKSFEEEFKKAEARGDFPKEQKEKIGEMLIMLRLAEEANGDAGAIFKHLALENLRKEHGEKGLDNPIETFQKKVPDAIDKVCELMPADKAEEVRNAFKEGKLGDMIKEGKLFKIEGMRELLFGKGMTEEKLKEILRIDKKKPWKDSLLLALIIMLIGPIEMGKEVVPLPK